MRGDRLVEINGKTIEEIEMNDLWETIFGIDEIGVRVDLKIEDSTETTKNLSLEKSWVTIDSVQYEDVFDLDGPLASALWVVTMAVFVAVVVPVLFLVFA